MKIKEGFVLRVLQNQNVVVTIGEARDEFHGMIRLNDTGKFLWEQLKTEKSEAELVSALMDVYGIDESTAKSGVLKFLSALNDTGCIQK